MDKKERLEKQMQPHRIKEPKKFFLHNFTIIVYPTTFLPIGSSSIPLRNFFEKQKVNYNSVLEIGCGSGIISLLASRYAREVIAIDINPFAVRSLKESIGLNSIENIEVRESDLFENVPEKFDLIIFNPPFMNLKPNSDFERAFTDENYSTLTKFFNEVKSHLNKDGKIIIEFSDMGDEKYLDELIKKHNFIKKLIYSESTLDFSKTLTNFYILELTPKK